MFLRISNTDFVEHAFLWADIPLYQLKPLYPKLYRVTCVAHLLHNCAAV